MLENFQNLNPAVRNILAQHAEQQKMSPAATVDMMLTFFRNVVREELLRAAENHKVADSLVQTSVVRPVPAVPIEDSVHDDYLICLEDGRRLKMLKRYLKDHYDLTPDQYRNRWGLPSDYPMTAPGYSNNKSRGARDNGLGLYPRD